MSQLFFKVILLDEGDLYRSLSDIAFFKITLGTFLIGAAGYIINDYYDVKIDVINRPKSVIIERVFSRKQAIIFHSVLNLLALMLGLSVNIPIFTIFLLSAILLWWYSNFLKKQAFWGNITIASLASITVLMLAFTYNTHLQILGFYSVLIFIITLAREILKDMEDLNGDKAFGCKTLPIVYGIRKTKVVVSIILTLFFLLVLVAPMYVSFSIQLLFLVTLSPLLLKIFIVLYKADTIKEFHLLSRLCKWVMIIGVLSILFVK